MQHLVLDDQNTKNGEMPQLQLKIKEKLEMVQILRSSKINYIPDRAFECCTSLKCIQIPNGVINIGGHAFDGCRSLELIVIPDGVINIGGYAFYGCKSLESIVIPNGVTTIEECVFRGCKSLRSIEIPKGATSIEECAFNGCTSLESIVVPDTVITIGEWAFTGCASLESIEIPNGVTTIQACTFRGCKSLKSIAIPDGVMTIGECAFHDCSSLQSIISSHGITTIERYAFCDCTSLKSVIISKGVTTIECSAFLGCTSLQLIAIPETATSTIRSSAFDHCNTLEERHTNGTNYHPDTTTWLQQRFNRLPIHRVCYYTINASSSSLNLLSTLARQNKQALVAIDAMGMTPLHILCCNPGATVEMVRVVVQIEPSLLSQRDMTQSTPLQQFLKCRNLPEAGQNIMPLLCDLLEKGVKGEDMNILLVLDINQEIDLSSQDEGTGLLPYMTAATMSTCGLDLVYTLALNIDLGMIS